LFPRLLTWDNWSGTEVACAAGGIREQEIFGNAAAILSLQPTSKLLSCEATDSSPIPPHSLLCHQNGKSHQLRMRRLGGGNF